MDAGGLADKDKTILWWDGAGGVLRWEEYVAGPI